MKALARMSLLSALCLAPLSAMAQVVAPDLSAMADGKSWKITHTAVEKTDKDGKPAVRLISAADSANGIVGLALPVGPTFTTGALEIDLKGKNVRGRSFLGVAFNVQDDKTFEAVYFRPFNFKAEGAFRDRAVQYISWPGNTWEHLRKNSPGKFEGRLDPAPDPDGWFHARIEVSATHVRVFVNDGKEPALAVERLAQGRGARPFGLFVDSADGYYANLRASAP